MLCQLHGLLLVAAELLEQVNFKRGGNEKCRCSCGKYRYRRLRRAAFQESRRDRLPVVSSG
jgi:hypothetical protein